MINSFKNPAIMRILRTTERHGAGWREQNFIPNDVQVMYIMESAPEQHRAKLCSMTKTIAYIGVAGIPFLRMAFMGDVVTK